MQSQILIFITSLKVSIEPGNLPNCMAAMKLLRVQAFHDHVIVNEYSQRKKTLHQLSCRVQILMSSDETHRVWAIEKQLHMVLLITLYKVV